MTEPKNLVTEITVTIKDEDSRLTEKELCYSSVSLDRDDSTINSMILSALEKFGTPANGDAPDIIVKTKTVWQ